MTVTLYDNQEFKEINITNVAKMRARLARSDAGGRRLKVWIFSDVTGRSVSFKQTRYEIRKIGG